MPVVGLKNTMVVAGYVFAGFHGGWVVIKDCDGGGESTGWAWADFEWLIVIW
jgi:hypothetical protein